MDATDFSLTELERRLHALPDGPASVLNTPRWLLMWNAVGTVGVILGLLPSLLIEFWAPRMWMAFMAQVGTALMLIGYVPGFVRSAWVLCSSFVGWRTEQVRQLDDDIVHFRQIGEWLATFPRDALDERLRFVRSVSARLTAKAGLLAGGLDKLGVIPIVVAVCLQLRTYVDGNATLPVWQAVVGLFLAVTYLIAFLASLMRLRLQLYEAMLADALERQAKP